MLSIQYCLIVFQTFCSLCYFRAPLNSQSLHYYQVVVWQEKGGHLEHKLILVSFFSTFIHAKWMNILPNFVKTFNESLHSSSKYFLNSTFQSLLNLALFCFVHEWNLLPLGFILFTFTLAKLQNEIIICQILLKRLMNLYGQTQNIFWTQPFGFCWIWFCFFLFMNEIFCPTQILQLPSHAKCTVSIN
jgi:hypothetical protein